LEVAITLPWWLACSQVTVPSASTAASRASMAPDPSGMNRRSRAPEASYSPTSSAPDHSVRVVVPFTARSVRRSSAS
jgi:hypothetical protein